MVFVTSERMGDTSREGCVEDGLLWRLSCKVRLDGPACLYVNLGGDDALGVVILVDVDGVVASSIDMGPVEK